MKGILISNLESLKKKIEQIKKDGVSHLHIVSDFDRTLTPAFIDGKKPSTSFAQIREGGYLSEKYFQKAQVLFHKYQPLEISQEISLEEKKKHMSVWWEAHLNLMVKYGLQKSFIEDVINKKILKFRKGTKEFLDVLAIHKIPILIFSAGLGDIIKEFMISEGVMHHNIHIISNLFEFDTHGKAIGCHKPVIHTFNKDEGQIKDSPYYEQIKNKRNAILIGDMLSDCDMVHGLSHENVIKIGFLNENIEKLKDEFLKNFDVIVLNDGTFDYINALLKEII